MKAHILIVGGYGVVGRYLAEQLAGFPITVAGRSLDEAQQFARTLGHVQARHLDVQDKASLDEALADVQLVISCAPMDEPTLSQAAIARGCDYLDVGERTAFLKRARVLHEDARKAGVTAVIGMGLMPGIVNVMARAAVERLGDAERLETALLRLRRVWRGGVGVYLRGVEGVSPEVTPYRFPYFWTKTHATLCVARPRFLPADPWC